MNRETRKFDGNKVREVRSIAGRRMMYQQERMGYSADVGFRPYQWH